MNKILLVLVVITFIGSCALLDPSWDKKLEIIREDAERSFKRTKLIHELDPMDEDICGGNKNLYLCTAYRRFGGTIYYSRWYGKSSNTGGFTLMKNGEPIAMQTHPCGWRWKADKGYCGN